VRCDVRSLSSAGASPGLPRRQRPSSGSRPMGDRGRLGGHIAPFRYGRWDAAAQADHAANDKQINRDAARAFGAPGAFDPESTRAALATFGSPVLLLAGELDLNTVPRLAAEFAALFPSAKLVVQPGGGHSPCSMTPTGSRHAAARHETRAARKLPVRRPERREPGAHGAPVIRRPGSRRRDPRSGEGPSRSSSPGCAAILACRPFWEAGPPSASGSRD
jgi:TAP-like protein